MKDEAKVKNAEERKNEFVEKELKRKDKEKKKRDREDEDDQREDNHDDKKAKGEPASSSSSGNMELWSTSGVKRRAEDEGDDAERALRALEKWVCEIREEVVEEEWSGRRRG